jgi:predicted Zn-dependent peptidase
VILEEIKSYKDSPSELIYDDFESYLFGEHPFQTYFGNNFHCQEDNVGDIKNFTSKFYLRVI